VSISLQVFWQCTVDNYTFRKRQFVIIAELHLACVGLKEKKDRFCAVAKPFFLRNLTTHTFCVLTPLVVDLSACT